MVVSLQAEALRHRLIGQDDIQLVHGQLAEQLLK